MSNNQTKINKINIEPKFPDQYDIISKIMKIAGGLFGFYILSFIFGIYCMYRYNDSTLHFLTIFIAFALILLGLQLSGQEEDSDKDKLFL